MSWTCIETHTLWYERLIHSVLVLLHLSLAFAIWFFFFFFGNTFFSLWIFPSFSVLSFFLLLFLLFLFLFLLFLLNHKPFLNILESPVCFCISISVLWLSILLACYTNHQQIMKATVQICILSCTADKILAIPLAYALLSLTLSTLNSFRKESSASSIIV